MIDNIKGFHIEPTNICTLKCPRCSRTKFIKQFPKQWKNHELDLDHLINFIDIPITNMMFRLCGDYGDPIYYSKLFEMVKWIKSNGAYISLHTNGSYRTADWWHELCFHLDTKDKIIFAIDGIPDNFTNYRINADWKSIENGIKICSSKIYTIWQYIPFSYNVEFIDEARQLSKNLGMHEFVVKPSSRWEAVDDILKPTADHTASDGREVVFKKNIKEQFVDPRCKKTNNEHFITANGYYAPCCHVPNHNFYYKSEFYKEKEKYEISKTTFTKVLENTKYFYDNLETNKPIYCIYNCAKL